MSSSNGNSTTVDRSGPWDRAAPLIVLIALLMLGYYGYQRDMRDAGQRARYTDSVLASFVADRLSEHVLERSRDLQDLRQAYLSGTLNSDQFASRAAALRRDYPEYSTLALLQPDGVVVNSSGGDGRQISPGREVRAIAALRTALNDAARTNAVRISPVYKDSSGETLVGLCLAIPGHGKMDGYVLATLNGARLVTSCVPVPYRDNYNVFVQEITGSRLAGPSVPGPYAGLQSTMSLARNFRVAVWPFKPPTGSVTVFGTNVAFAVLISLMFWSALRERRKAESRAEDRRVAAEALRISEHRLADIVSKSPWVVTEHGLDGRVETVNPAAERVYRRPPKEMVGHSPEEWTHKEDIGRMLELVKTAFVNQDYPYFESRIIDSDGGIHYLRWTGTPRYDNAGTVTGSILFGLDITAELAADRERERLLIEEQRLIERLWVLNDFARSLRTTLDMGSLFQIAIRAASNVLADKWCAIVTYNPDTEMFSVATVWTSAPHAPAAPIISPGIRFRADSSSLTEAVRECRQVISDDLSLESTRRERELAASGFLSRAAVPIMVDNVCIGVIAAYSHERAAHSRDSVEFMQGIAEHLALALTSSRLFSELKMAYNEVREAQQQVVQMEKLRAVGEMASGIAHDFNNSLAAVIGYAELLAEEEQDAERATYLQHILKAAHDAATTVRRIQEYSRRVPAADSFTQIDVNALATEAVALTRHKWRDQAQSRGVTIDVDLKTEPDLPTVTGDASELREVLTNLVFNAVDAMPRGGHITVSTGRKGPKPFVMVKDEGTGMSEEVKARVFDPFFTTKGRDGNGLGLSVSYGIVRRHGGDLLVESELGEGSTFTVILPPAEEVVPVEAPAATNGHIRCTTALIIDDDPSVSGAVGALLEKLGNSVVVAQSGEEGLQKLQEGQFDVLFTDLGMPGMNGREVAVAAKKLAPKTSVVLLTGWGDHVRATEERPEGVDLVLGKPVKLEQLRDALHRVCSNGDGVNGTTPTEEGAP